MQIWEVFLLAVSLAMDALAVSVCKGLANGKVKIKYMLVCGIWFGLFQMLMPLIGFALAGIFASNLKLITPWVSFALLVFLGVKMIIESVAERKKNGSEKKTDKPEYGFVTMLLAAIATSIDALAVGVTFAFNGVSYNITVLNNIWLYIGIIGVITFVISATGNAMGGGLGAAFGIKFKFVAELIGGIILTALGVKFLVEGIISVCNLPPAEDAKEAVRLTVKAIKGIFK